jgi:hypothetical protein
MEGGDVRRATAPRAIKDAAIVTENDIPNRVIDGPALVATCSDPTARAGSSGLIGPLS